MRDLEQMIAECFASAMLLRDVEEDESSVRAVYDLLRCSIDKIVALPDQVDVDENGRSNIIYAIVALSDELALKSHDTLADFWMPRLLQIHYFQENAAGENFFNRLKILMHSPSINPIVIQSFYTSIALGFEGKYGILGRDSDLQRLLKTVHQSFHDPNWLEQRLLTPYPHAKREASPSSRKPIFSTQQVRVAAVMALVIWGACFFSARVYLSSHAQRIATEASLIKRRL